MIYILGAGIAGISAGYHLNKRNIPNVVLEKRATWGGLLDHFKIGAFTFDHCVHLSFTKDAYVQNLFAESTAYHVHKPESSNFYKGHWLRHPAQNNLFPLSSEEKIKIISDFVTNEHAAETTEIKNYEDWLFAQYGTYFTEHFPKAYTRKYWTLEARDLSTDWVGSRMYKPSIEEVLRGAFTEQTAHVYYASEMRYPIEGGYKSFLKKMAEETSIQTSSEVCSIHTESKKLTFSGSEEVSYDKIISTLPLPVLIPMLSNVPDEVKAAVELLSWTSVDLVSIGFSKPDIPKYLWFYMYDEDILPARAYAPSLKAIDNVPEGCSSLQFEIYSSKHKSLNLHPEELIAHVILKLVEMNICTRADIMLTDHRKVEYGNVIFDHHHKTATQTVHNYLDSKGILYAGRFGEWGYLWSDQSLLSGKKAADCIFVAT
ncbi:FAD-dependent oxidoreductase [uncultured Cytophaga sp.]|uniref:protoporphyrinogen/coproporphyrinogen oxidase n=1 Tax=uncultured Cytophaga sp. TaxID=160238 RepID=UPI0026242743|nr:FAD-dependent oxidoreductase [uncultured Cytophaga sp.]